MNTLRGEFELNILDKKEKCLLTLNALRMFSQAEKIKLTNLTNTCREIRSRQCRCWRTTVI